ncbi:MAG: hypothetical protein ACRDNZ_16710 [Streptosporangiaceae bacterium]
MYNLIVGFIDGEASADRVLEYTDNAVNGWVAPSGTVDVSRLANLPTLLMPELQDTRSPQVARVGHVEDLTLVGRDYQFRFVPSPAVPAIASHRINEASRLLRISDWEFKRTHLAVKDVDLYRVLHESILSPIMTPQVFRLPLGVPTEQGLVAVMMPFDARFDDVYTTLRQAVTESGMNCLRADDIWLNNHIMDDVINLIWRARVVIADLSSKNTNVFYETGIAHTLGREVIQIAQSMDDIPFDLRAIRSVTYLHNGEGLEHLKAQVVDRLKYLTTAS